MVARQSLTLFVKVRILVPQPCRRKRVIACGDFCCAALPPAWNKKAAGASQAFYPVPFQSKSTGSRLTSGAFIMILFIMWDIIRRTRNPGGYPLDVREINPAD